MLAATNCSPTGESPIITALAAALRHLEEVPETTTPSDEAAYYASRPTNEQLSTWVLNNADRIRRALDAITTPYQTTA